MIELVDDDLSGQIEFNEFLNILKSRDGDEGSMAIKTFFEELTNKKYGGNIAFPNLVLKLRRQSLLNAIRADTDPEQKKRGNRIMKNVRVQL